MIKAANDTTYGLACAVFTQNLNRAIETSRKIRAGTAWVRYHSIFCLFLRIISLAKTGQLHYSQVPFGGYKQSGIGRECGEYALDKCAFFPFDYSFLK